MSEPTAVEAPAAKEPFFKMSSIPGANILVPLLLGCLLNTLFPDLFKTLGSFTLGMTQQGAGPLVGAFLLIVGTTISFKSAPAAAARGAGGEAWKQGDERGGAQQAVAVTAVHGQRFSVMARRCYVPT